MKNNYLILLFFFVAVQIKAQQFAAPITNPFDITSIGLGQAWSKPVFVDLDNNIDYDMLAGDQGGKMRYYQNTGNVTNPTFGLAPTVNQFGWGGIDFAVAPAIADLDSDGDFDLIVGGGLLGPITGIFYVENTGSVMTPAWSTPILDTLGIISEDTVVKNYTPTLADLDNDGDFDLLVGMTEGSFLYYENTGDSTNPSFGAAQNNPFGLTDIGDNSAPNLGDLDGDGDLDLISGAKDGNFYYFENTGTASNPSFGSVQTNPFGLVSIANNSVPSIGEMSAPFFVDLDGDGDLDLMAGHVDGNFYYFENDPTLSVDMLNNQGLGMKIYPNPVSEELTLELPTSANYQVRITDLTGREVYNEFVQGDNNLQLSTKAWPTGLYLLQVRDEEGNVETKKIVKQ